MPETMYVVVDPAARVLKLQSPPEIRYGLLQ